VVIIAGLVEATGRVISHDILTGEWQAGSGLWPEARRSPKSWWALFRKCMRDTFCTKTPIYQPANYCLELDLPLGRWLPIEIHCLFECYKSKPALYWRDKEEIHFEVMKPSAETNFYQLSHTVETLPLESHPIKSR